MSEWSDGFAFGWVGALLFIYFMRWLKDVEMYVRNKPGDGK